MPTLLPPLGGPYPKAEEHQVPRPPKGDLPETPRAQKKAHWGCPVRLW